MSELLNVSALPHARSKDTTQKIMFDVLIALVPVSAFGIYQFGAKALFIILACIITCVITEYGYQRLMKIPVTISDGSAILTGLLLALNLSPTVPIWIPVLGGVFAILVIKQIFGGLGQNFMNPALAARCFLLISFTGRMSTFTTDVVSGATPLAQLKAGESVDLAMMFIGKIPGTIGETSAIAILIGAAYLLVRKVISITIPGLYIGTFAIFLALFGGNGFDVNYILAHVCGGGLLLGAFFMATDYVTCPITPMGKVIFGVTLGLLTGIFRLFGSMAEGVSYAIIFCNLLVPLIERVTIPKPFGRESKR